MISLPVHICESMWTKMAQSDSFNLWLIALRRIPDDCSKECFRSLIDRVLEHATRLDDEIWTSKLVDKFVDWELFDKYGPKRLSLSNFALNLAKKVDTFDRLSRLLKDSWISDLRWYKIEIVESNSLFFQPDTCSKALKLLLRGANKYDTSKILNSWLKKLLQQSEISPLYLNLVRRLKKVHPKIDFLEAFSDDDSKLNSLSCKYLDLLPTFNKELISDDELRMYNKFLIKICEYFDGTTLTAQVSRMPTKELVHLGHCCLSDPLKFKQYIWPELCFRYNVTEATSNHLALDIYKSDSAFFSRKNWAEHPTALESFSDDNIVYILEYCFPIPFLKAHPQFIPTLNNTGRLFTKLDDWASLGCEHLTDQQLATFNWPRYFLTSRIPPEFMARITRKDANILPPDLLKDLEFLNESKKTVTVEFEETAQCAVCIVYFKEQDQGELVQLSCKHTFHIECCRNWIKSQTDSGRSTCPMCRAPIFEEILNFF